MAGGGGKQRSMEVTPTWAVAVVCFVLVAISILIEHAIDHVGSWLKKRQKQALYEALEKIKAELMLLGFISLLLTVTEETIISKICIPEKYGKTWHPCKNKEEKEEEYDENCSEGKVPFMSSYAIHQLHIFLFVLALTHVLYCITTLGLGTLKMKRWKVWEDETKTIEYQFNHEEERFRFARETSFGRRHLKFWSRSDALLWTVCFFRQFIHSVMKVDYLTLRHGFITAHLAPQSQGTFDFQKYISRSLEEDFKVVVGISPIMWLFAVLFLLTNTRGWYSYLWLPFIPLIIILVVGAKLQVIITKMGVRILERGDVVKGPPVVQPRDDLFWFGRPRLILHLIHFVLFANAYQLGFFFYSWYKFDFRGCFHQRIEDIVIRLSMGVITQVLCSYVTLPFYALVTQMGSNMRPAIFNDRVASAVRSWHHTAKKQAKHRGHIDGNATPSLFGSRPETPMHGMSPVHLLQGHQDSNINAVDSLETTPRTSNVDINEVRRWDAAAEWSQHQQEIREVSSAPRLPPPPASGAHQHQVQISLSEFSFNTK